MRLAWFVLVIAALLESSPGFAQSPEDLNKQGERVFNRSCATGYCHGLQGVAAGAPRLAARGFDQAYIDNTVARGLQGTSMPAFTGSLSRSDLNAVVAYVAKLNGIVYSPAGSTESGAGTGVQPSLSPEASKGRDLFSDELRGFNRCSTCHEVNGIGIPVAGPIAKVPANVKALRELATPSVRTAVLGNQTMPALVINNGSRASVFYDLTTPPPVLHTAQPGTVTWREGSDWHHASVLGSYSDAELGLILEYLRSAVQR
jgi:mono/diheme cytochrome c family protein